MQRTKPLRSGKDRRIVHKPSASATRPIDSDFSPCLCQRAVPCYSQAWLRLAAGSVRFFTSRSSGTLPKTRPFPIYSIYIKPKAVPVAASSSELASGRPTRSELRPHSLTALRIQLSSDHEVDQERGAADGQERAECKQILGSYNFHLTPLHVDLKFRGARACEPNPHRPTAGGYKKL